MIEKKQTAIQELIHELEEMKVRDADTPSEKLMIKLAIHAARKKLHKEKEVIDDAYFCGLNRGVELHRSQTMGRLCEWPSDRDYYNETYGDD